MKIDHVLVEVLHTTECCFISCRDDVIKMELHVGVLEVDIDINVLFFCVSKKSSSLIFRRSSILQDARLIDLISFVVVWWTWRWYLPKTRCCAIITCDSRWSPRQRAGVCFYFHNQFEAIVFMSTSTRIRRETIEDKMLLSWSIRSLIIVSCVEVSVKLKNKSS